MIDEDDDIPSFVVGSGSEHHVSVSEHTGNAKTPHNKVVSHEEETQARKLAFEKHDSDSGSTQKPAPNDAAANLQNIPNDALGSQLASAAGPQTVADKQQAVSSDTTREKNQQSLAADPTADSNRQKIGASAQTPNVQGLANDAGADHRVGIPTEGVGHNSAAVPADVAANNRQSLAADAPVDSNRQPLPGTPAAQGASAAAHPSGVNEQQIPTLNEMDNRQPVQNQGLSDNRQALGQPNAEPNLQGLGALANGPNHQAAPSTPEPGANRQAVGAQALQDHREAASSAPIERAKVDFSPVASSSAQASPSDTPDTTQAGKAKKKPRPGVTLPGLIADPSAASPEALDAAAEFHRRVLDIKHNVDNLNHRLTDFEQNEP